ETVVGPIHVCPPSSLHWRSTAFLKPASMYATQIRPLVEVHGNAKLRTNPPGSVECAQDFASLLVAATTVRGDVSEVLWVYVTTPVPSLDRTTQGLSKKVPGASSET